MQHGDFMPNRGTIWFLTGTAARDRGDC